VKFSAEHLKRVLESKVQSPKSKDTSGSTTLGLGHRTLDFRDLIVAGPAPAPLLRAENFYRYQIMLRTRAMSALSRELAQIIQSLTLPEGVSLAVDIDPVSLS